MSQISNTPSPPYYAVIFTSIRTDIEHEEYRMMANEMENAVKSANPNGIVLIKLEYVR